MLSTSQREEFEQQGFVRLPGAFARAAAEAMESRVWRWLEKKHGARREDPTSWSAAAVYGMQGMKREAVFDAIGSDTLCAALDELVGAGRWERPRDWGGFLVNFPSGAGWTLPSGIWHTDFAYGGPADHAHGALVLSFLSEVPAGAGGTLVVAGSHRLIRKFVERRPQAGREKMKRTREAFLRSHPWLVALSSETPQLDRVERLVRETTIIDGIPVRVEELCGEAGDVVIGHSWLLHASAPNCGARPRIMRVQRVHAASGPALAAEA